MLQYKPTKSCGKFRLLRPGEGIVWDCIIFWDNYLFVSHLLFWVNFGAKTFTFFITILS